MPTTYNEGPGGGTDPAQGLNVGESVTPWRKLAATSTDAFTVDNDPVLSQIAWIFQDTFSMQESLTANQVMGNVLADGVGIEDVIRIVWDALFEDTFSVNETTVTLDVALLGATAELLVVTEQVSDIKNAVALIAEIVALSQIVSGGYHHQLGEDFSVDETEASALYKAIISQFGDTFSVTEDATPSGTLGLLVSDSAGLSDSLSFNQVLQGVLEDKVFMGGALFFGDDIYTAYVINSESMALTEYTNFPFNSFGKLGDVYIGATDTAIYALSGDNDDGTNIDAVLRTGMTNFGTNLYKRVPRAYLGYTSTGAMVIKVISTDTGTKSERWYELKERTGGRSSDSYTAARIKLGRGVKATYWQFELVNVSGADFDMDTMQLLPIALQRRV